MKKYIFALFLLLIIIAGVIAAAANRNPYLIFIDAQECKLYLFREGELIKTYPCASGKTTTPSPIGRWKIISKDTWGEGFGGRWMGFNVPWGKFGIHGTIYPNSIGWSSSKGCIRMNNKDVAELYKIVPHGTTVIIEDGVYGDFGNGFRYLRPGMYGADVMQIQKRLKEMGYFRGHVNGKYEASLTEAVHKFQRANNMKTGNVITPEMQKKMGFLLME